jgi:hypothetical protein
VAIKDSRTPPTLVFFSLVFFSFFSFFKFHFYLFIDLFLFTEAFFNFPNYFFLIFSDFNFLILLCIFGLRYFVFGKASVFVMPCSVCFVFYYLPINNQVIIFTYVLISLSLFYIFLYIYIFIFIYLPN